MRFYLMGVALGLALFACNRASAVGLGVREDGLAKSFIVSDWSKFTPDKPDAFGLYRYGIGRGQVELGHRSGIFSDANNGILLSDTEGVVGGIEVTNGTIAYHGTNELAWRPGASLGYTKGVFYAAPRVMYNASNIPGERAGLGIGSVIQLGPATYWENPGMKIYSLNVGKNVNIEKRNNDTFFFSVRSDW